MASDIDFVEYACEQMRAKPHFRIDDQLASRVRATCAELPEPKPKKPKATKPKR